MRFLFLFFLGVQLCLAQPVVYKVEPPNWWTGMQTNSVQLMVYGENLGGSRVTSPSRHLTVTRTHNPGNPSYLFIDVTIRSTAAPGSYTLTLSNAGGSTHLTFPILKRDTSSSRHNGFDVSDIIYLIVPDRFVNGDTTNDSVAGMPDTLNRLHPYGRHGGDIRGIITSLDYLNDLGVTALWTTPLVENNTAGSSYHGYAATDLYRIDPRFGTHEEYVTLVREAHRRGLKVIMDHVNNHISIAHPWIKNLPTPDWLNGTPENHAKPFHSKVELDDIHSDSLTKLRAENGWFTHYMPDLNQRNPFVANYLTTSTLWWIESTGIDGIREDTYPYIHPAFRERWCEAILREYPRFNIVGEVWIHDPVHVAPYQRGGFFPVRKGAALPTVTDFGLFDAFMKTFADSAGRIDEVFQTLAKDFLYPDPHNLVTFLDNHDIRRIMFNVNGDAKRFKLAILALLTTRGIPQILYGTEIGMMGGPDHGRLRADFPGGFPGDVRNAFTAEGRTDLENEIFNYTKHLLKLRRTFKSLQTGRMVHFRPEKNVYVYFRMHGNERLMMILNRSTESRTVDLQPYEHHLPDVIRLRDLLTGKEYDISGRKEVTLDAMNGAVFQIVYESQ